MNNYLKATDIIDYHDENIQALAKKLSLGTNDFDWLSTRTKFESFL